MAFVVPRPRVPWPFGHLVTWAHRARRAIATRRLADLILVGLVALTIYAWWYSLRWGFMHDGPVVMYPAHLMRTGQRILYRDLIDMNQPATFLAMGIVDGIAGTDDQALRIADVVVLALTCALTPDAFRMPRRLPGWAGSALYAVFHLRECGADALQREVWVLLFVVASGAALRHRHWVLGGIFAGLAMFVKFHALAFAIVLLAGHLTPATRWREMARWALGVAATAAFLIGGLALFGAADDWWWVVRNYLPLYAQLSGARGFEPDPWEAWRERIRLLWQPGEAQLVWVFPLAFWLMLTANRRNPWARPAVMAASFFFVGWLYPIPAGTFWTYHLIPAFFGAGVVIAVVIGASVRDLRAPIVERVAIACLALWVARTEMQPWWDNGQRHARDRGINLTARDVASYLRGHLGPGETAQPLDTVIGVVDGMWRADAPLATSFAYQFMFYHHPQSATTRTLRARFIHEMEEARPALVIRAIGLPWVAGGAAATTEFPELEQLLARHYVVEERGNGVTYFRRVDPWQ